jgi:serine/threonine-protein kinase RsbW
MEFSEEQTFPVETASLKSVRSFAREIFEKYSLFNNQKDELILAIAESAQNIIKHAYKEQLPTSDNFKIKISFSDNTLEIGFFDRGKPVNSQNIKHRSLDDIKPGGLGTYFVKQIMDQVLFKEHPDWKNHLVLTKKY